MNPYTPPENQAKLSKSKKIKEPSLTLIMKVSAFIGVLLAAVLILFGGETRARMDAEVAARGRGYGGQFQIINSVMAGVVYAAGIFAALLIIKLIIRFTSKEKS